MKINGEIYCDVEPSQIKKYGNGVRLLNLKLKTKAKKETAAEVFGEDLARIAFAGMEIAPDKSIKHAFGTMTKPSLVCESHDVEIAGHEFRCMPEVPSLEPVDGEEAVVVSLVLPLEVTSMTKDKIADVLVLVGEGSEISWTPIQQTLPLVQKDNRGEFGNASPRLV